MYIMTCILHNAVTEVLRLLWSLVACNINPNQQHVMDGGGTRCATFEITIIIIIQCHVI